MNPREILVSTHDDGSAEFTVCVNGGKNRFSAAPSGDQAVLSFEETMHGRDLISDLTPSGDMFETLMQSEEMSDYLDSTELRSVRRQRE